MAKKPENPSGFALLQLQELKPGLVSSTTVPAGLTGCSSTVLCCNFAVQCTVLYSVFAMIAKIIICYSHLDICGKVVTSLVPSSFEARFLGAFTHKPAVLTGFFPVPR